METGILFYELLHPYIYEDPVFHSFYIVFAEPRVVPEFELVEEFVPSHYPDWDLLSELMVSSLLGTHSGNQSRPPVEGLDHIPADGPVFVGDLVHIDSSSDSSLRSFPEVIVISDDDDEDPEENPEIVEILSLDSYSLE
ncbi:hypothetical protein AHAS_Ahas13G0301900 [Arachis hypogaea]